MDSMRDRVIIRSIPGFTWVQFGLGWKWHWDPKGYWAVRGFAKTRRFGPLWICTMRTDCIERAKRDGIWKEQR